jgi:hypothetical protein
MKAYGGVQVSPRILNLGSQWMLVISFTLRQFYH